MNATKQRNIQRSETSTTQMFQPSQTQCISPTRDQSPTRLTRFWLEIENIQDIV